MYNPYALRHHRRRESRSIALLLGVLVLGLSTACGHASTSSRIRKLANQEVQLRSSVETLQARQRALHQEIQRAETQAAMARCHASQASYRAAVATVFSEYSAAVAENKGCQASAAKEGGTVAALGCGLATFFTGGWALAVCGGSLIAGAAMSNDCDAAPSPMTEGDVHRIAQQRTGLSGLPRCDQPSVAGDVVWGSLGSSRRPYDREDRPYMAPSSQGSDVLFRVPTRKERRRARIAQRKQVRSDRTNQRAAEKQRDREERARRAKAKKRAKGIRKARRKFRGRR